MKKEVTQVGFHKWFTGAVLVVVFAFASGAKAGNQPFAYATWWASLGKSGQLLYLEAYKDGYTSGMMDAVFHIRPDKEAEYFDCNIGRPIVLQSPFRKGIDLETMRRVITEIYKDPANNYLEISWVLKVAADKLEGKPIDKQLERYRVGVWKIKELLEKNERLKK